MSKPVILTGLRANNDLHIGNYFGALLPLVDMARSRADEYEINLFVPDLHSFTTPIDHSKLYEQTMHNLKLFVAAGLPLDHPSVHIYRQSYVPAHSELTWILDCFTGYDEMRRMTQFKDKSLSQSSKRHVMHILEDIAHNRRLIISEHERKAIVSFFERLLKIAPTLEHYQEVRLNTLIDQDRELDPTIGHALATAISERVQYVSETPVSLGLFNYPVLMAADILLYGASYVPVGDDQSQHLEFARDIAERMNARFGELFTMPKPVKEQHAFFGKEQGLRIKDLADPTKKMSKSDESSRGVIFLGDSPDEAAKKIMSATTDSVGVIHYDSQNQPGVTNLLQILALASGKELGSVTHEYEGQTSYGALKTAVAAAVGQLLTDFQAKLAQVDAGALMSKLEAGEKQMNDTANATLFKVQKAVGLRN